MTRHPTSSPRSTPHAGAPERIWLMASGASSLLLAAALLSGCAATDESSSAPGATGVLEQVDGSAALALVADGARVVDVRTPEEFDTGHVVGALNIDLQSDTFLEQVKALPVDEPYVVYCATGNRSAQATALMAQEGFTEVYDAGGFTDLANAGAEVSAR